jgi:hypothetical protein
MRVEAVARAVLGRLLHEPTIRLRSLSAERTLEGTHGGGPPIAGDTLKGAGKQAGAHASLQLVRELFGLDEEPAREDPVEDAEEKLAEVRSIKSAKHTRK